MEPAQLDQAGSEPELQERDLTLVDGPVRVRVEGQGLAGSAPGHVPTLLLGFYREGDTAPCRESLVAARSLDELDAEDLEAAWRTGGEPRGVGRRANLFSESVGDRRKGR